MIETLKKLCGLNSPSGREQAVREFIIGEIGSAAEIETDKMGNLIVKKQGKKRPAVQLMLDAHMDEVGFIITYITDGGLLKFSTIGGIDSSVIIGRRVVFESGIYGVVGGKPVHLMTTDEGKKLPKTDSMYIDIGAKSRADAQKKVAVGDSAVFDTDFLPLGKNRIKAKALDNRIGCAILLEMIKSDLPYDMTFTFTVQEEVGLRGAATAAFKVSPDAAIVLEATTAADFDGNPEDKYVCELGNGAVLSFMDGATLYDKKLYDAALETAAKLNISCQPKAAVAGGNNAGSIHKSGAGVRTLAISVPCRYIHSASCVADLRDITSAARLTAAMAEKIASGQLDD